MNMISFNIENIIRKNIPKNIQLPRRAQIYVGFKCNLKCGFCYYKHKCNDTMFDLDFIKSQIKFLYNYGIRDFEITGGEPSEYKFLRDICVYIKTYFPTSKIAIITNGGLYNSQIWDIIDEVVISYHLSKNPIYYDKTMFPLGSTWNKVLKTIINAKNNNVLIRTNTVIGTFNIDNINDIVKDLIEFLPNIINFLPVNLFETRNELANYVNYNYVRSILKENIDVLKTTLSNSLIFIRYMPFCDMENYEQYLVGHLLHIYDWFDWNRELAGSNYIYNITNSSFIQLLGNYGSTSITAVNTTRNEQYEKTNKCLTCKYYLICDGVEKTNLSILTKYIKPSKGEIIKNPLHYIKNTSYDFYNLWYTRNKIK